MPTYHKLALPLPTLLCATLLAACASQEHNEQLASTVTTDVIIEQGKPGGMVLETEKVQAVVSAIDYQKRTFTLQDEMGHRRTFHAIPEMLNFPQLQVGDKVTASIAQERLVYLREPGEEARNGSASVLAAAPEGSKPGLLSVDTTELSAVVKAIDKTQRTATLEFADGTRKTVKVRQDVELSDKYLNRQVVIRLTSATAISVEAD